MASDEADSVNGATLYFAGDMVLYIELAQGWSEGVVLSVRLAVAALSRFPPPGSAAVGGVVVGVKRNEPEEIAVAKADCPDSLTETQRVDPAALRSLEMLDRFPLKARVPIESAPIHPPKATQGGDHLLQGLGLETEENFLEFGAVEVEPHGSSTLGPGATPSAATRRAGTAPARQRLEIRFPWRDANRPREAARDPRPVGLLCRPDLALRYQRNGRQHHRAVVAPI